ncbi:SseB family protein [Pseudolactococcus yaeyamensis]
MTDYQFSPELDERLRDFIAHSGNFVADIGFVHALHAYPVVGIAEPFVLPIEDKKVIPVFSSVDALASFQQRVTDPLTFVNQSFMTVVDQLLAQGFDAIAFNLQPAGQDSPHAIMLARDDLLAFLNYYTDALNKLMGSASQGKAQTERYYLMPAFVRTTAEGETARIFATLSKPNGESFVPVFSNILSFAKWYNHADFGVPFQAHGGLVLVWQLNDLQQPSTGINELEDVLGVAVDPFDAVDYEKSVMLWEALGNTVKDA